ncbi:MAG: hypothetical protein AAF566_05555, partial [Pseudomonadota bacterium]
MRRVDHADRLRVELCFPTHGQKIPGKGACAKRRRMGVAQNLEGVVVQAPGAPPKCELEISLDDVEDVVELMRDTSGELSEGAETFAGGFAGYRCALKDVTLAVESSRRAQELTTQLQHSERLRSLGELTGGV